MKKSIFLLSGVVLFSQYLIAPAYAIPTISEKDQGIVNRAVENITNTEKADNYLQKLATIENRVLQDKYAIYDFLNHAISRQKNKLLFDKSSFEGTTDVLTDKRVIPVPYKKIADSVKKIVYVNSDFEFKGEDGRMYTITPYLYIRLSLDPSFIRTVERTYDLPSEYMMINRDTGEYMITVKGYKIEQQINPKDLPYTAKNFLDFKRGINTEWLGVKPLTIDGVDYVLDASEYRYAYLPLKPFYLSRYSNLPAMDKIRLAVTDREIQVFEEGTSKIYKYPFHIKNNTVNKYQNLAYLWADLIHFSSNPSEAMSPEVNGDSWDKIEGFTKKLVNGANTDQEKIRRIYTWIIQNITYNHSVYDYVVNNNIDLDNKNVLASLQQTNIEAFSGLGAFKNKQAVCQGITKLFYYMLSSAGVKNAFIVDGFANNTDVYLQHSWVRIGDRYYDPTFDLWKRNPVWYALPKDIMYTNRDFRDNIRYGSMTSEELKQDFYNKLTEQAEKYGRDSYPIFTQYLR